MNKQWPDKTIVGLTGNIATGKSAVMKLAAEKGALTLDADRIVHEIMDNDPSMQAAIGVAFGPEVRKRDGTIDRAALGAIVFSDEEALRDLELIVHPAVRQVIDERVGESDHPVVVIEAIKLLEGDLVELCDQVWVTRCPRQVQMQRLMVCRGLDAETATARIDAQGTQEAKVARADVVIDTAGTMASTEAQFDLAWARLPGTEAIEEKPAPPQKPAPAPPRETAEPQPATTAEPAATAATEKSAPPAAAAEPQADGVTVRRARPSDIPAILLLIHKATEGEVKLKRADMLMAFSERSYLIGQTGTEISTVVGWNTDSTTSVCVDQIYVHPPEAIRVTGPAVLAEIEKSGRQLICEVAMVFLPEDEPEELRQLLHQSGYEKMPPEKMRRAWQKTVEEMQPENTSIMLKVLRNIRIA